MKRLLSICMALLIAVSAMATEGMWVPLFLKNLNEQEMKALGMRITADDIYNINKSSLKDAVVSFGGFCTGEVISGSGLVLTNHHCGYGAIQSHSSVENDYLTDGYWAMSKDKELPNEDLFVRFIVRIEDVTSVVLKGVKNGIPEETRTDKIKKNIEKLKKKAVKGTHYEAIVKPFYNGNEFYMFITETFTDIRLVGAPPSSIGKYGGDTDNWMWPRHTGDFSIFRIYAGPDNKPAPYSKDNVPYKPNHHFPISLTGGELGDFTFVYGFPGSTQEYLTSYAVDLLLNRRNPLRIQLREEWLNTVGADMKKSDRVRIQYASKYAGISNYHKKWIGENRGLRRLNAVTVKQEMEKEFSGRVAKNEAWNKAYGSVLGELKSKYEAVDDITVARDAFLEVYYRMSDIHKIARQAYALVNAWDESTGKLKPGAMDRFRKASKKHFKDFNSATETQMLSRMLTMYDQKETDLKPGLFKTVHEQLGGDFGQYTKQLMATTVLADASRLETLLKDFNAENRARLQNDPAVLFYMDGEYFYETKILPTFKKTYDDISLLNRTYVKGLREVFAEKRFYPDANSSLRIAYGQVDDYEPRDAVQYSHYTTLDGVIEKYDPHNDEFNLPKKLIELWEKKDYGQYGYKGELRVCFTASNHTTGGNSGSPVLDAYGNLLGCNFDRNWEGTMSDIMYDPDRCRNITCDIRYVLFIVDKFAGATHLIDELTLVKPNYQRAKKADQPISE